MAKEGRKQEILDVALACFNELGVEATTIDMIRTRSGASVGSMYHHFGSKESIAIALHEAALAHLQQSMEARLSLASDAEATVRAFVLGFADGVASDPALVRYLMLARGFMVRTASEAVQESAARERQSVLFAEWLGPHIKSGALRKLPRECYAPLILGPLMEYIWQWLAGRVTAAPSRHATMFATSAWQSVAA